MFPCKSVRMKKRSVRCPTPRPPRSCSASPAGEVVGYDLLSSADTTISMACVDANAKTILTVPPRTTRHPEEPRRERRHRRWHRRHQNAQASASSPTRSCSTVRGHRLRDVHVRLSEASPHRRRARRSSRAHTSTRYSSSVLPRAWAPDSSRAPVPRIVDSARASRTAVIFSHPSPPDSTAGRTTSGCSSRRSPHQPIVHRQKD